MKWLCFLLLISSGRMAAQDFATYVNPMTGTGGVGHTYPGATVPFGMVQMSPDTRNDASWEGCSGYWYRDSLIYGFSHTHLSGTGCSDYGDVLLIPGSGKPQFQPKKYGSPFDHQSEKASPGYYSVVLSDHNIRCEMTASTRCGIQQYHFPTGTSPFVLLDLMHRDKVLASSIRIVNDRTIEGYRRSEAWARDQYVFFSMEFSQPFAMVQMQNRSSELKPGDSADSDSIRLAIYFPGLGGKPLEIRTGISSVHAEGARNNRLSETSGKTFEKLVQQARQRWNEELSRIQVFGGSQKNKVNFYTALYHSMVVPNVYSDADGRYRGRDHAIHKAEGYTHYTVFSLWDTFRAAHPLYALIDRKRSLDYIKTFLAQYEQAGRLPVWELSANETDCMIGYHSASVIADALAKGINGFDAELAFAAMKKSAGWNHLGLPAFNANGYIQVDDESESVSKTLEYAYDAWCIAQVARFLGKKEEARHYDRLAAGWRNVYDPKSGFMRPRKNGNWLSPFDPREVNNHYTEANSYQYSFFVTHDIPGLIREMGGEQAFEKKLDGLFGALTSTTGREQADITGMIGQYAHGNEPSHHMAYLYTYIGKPWKTQAIVHRVLDSLYHTGHEGLPGNEDCGQMSAWYVWSALGLYPVTPGGSGYAISSPLFERAIIRLENGKTLEIRANKPSAKSLYLKSLRWNSKPYDLNLISFDLLKNGGLLEAQLSEKPNLNRGRTLVKGEKNEDNGFIKAPFIQTDSRFFADSASVVLSHPEKLPIRYRLNDDKSQTFSYSKPFCIRENTRISAWAVAGDNESGKAIGSFYRLPHTGWEIKLLSKPNRQYSAEGPKSLIDGIEGLGDWRKGDWLGFQERDMEVIFQFGKEESIGRIRPGFLQDTRSWILMPQQFSVEFSLDGQQWSAPQVLNINLDPKEMNSKILRPELRFAPVKAGWMRFRAKQFGKLPEWHPGAGGDSFIFCDEIEVFEQ
jgi:predicted alpha-1,2-mannosidase